MYRIITGWLGHLAAAGVRALGGRLAASENKLSRLHT